MKKNESSGIPLKVGVVGCGGIAQVIHLPLLSKHPDVELTALCEVDSQKAAILADKFDIPEIFEDVTEMLNRETLDAVFILTPNNLHLPMSLFALEKGLHVFLEKPAGRNSEETLRIKEKAESIDKIVMIGMQNRFRKDVRALRHFIQAKELEELFFVKAAWLQAQNQAVKPAWQFQKNVAGGGVVMDLGLQMIDLVWWLLGKPQPERVKAFAYQVNPNIPVEDFCVICITFENNLAFSLQISWDFPILQDQFSLELVAQHGIGSLNPLKLQKFMHGQMMNITPEMRESKYTNFKLGYQNEVNHFIDYLTGRAEILESPLEDSITISRLIDCIYQSIETKKEIEFN
jgi:predicted dehydrogenase